MLSHIHVMGICLYKTMAAEIGYTCSFNGTWLILGYYCVSQTSTKRKSLLHVLLICRRCGYWNWDLKSGVQRNFICASIKILLIKISSLLTKILSRKDSWSEKPRVHAKTHYHENFLYRIPIPLYINLMVSTYIPFYAKKNKW